MALHNATLFDLRYDITMLILFGIGLSAFGYVVFQFTEKRARKTGALGKY